MQQKVENCQAYFNNLTQNTGTSFDINEETKSKGQILKKAVLSLKREKEKLSKAIDELKLHCSSVQSSTKFIRPIETVVISLIRQLDNMRETDVCLGTLINSGYITSNLCCQADEILFSSLKTLNDIAIDTKKYFIGDYICLFNTTNTFLPNLSMDNHGTQQCSILTFDDEQEKFDEISIQFKIKSCFENPCELDLIPENFVNKTIFNGTFISCNDSSVTGVITHSKYIQSKIALK